MNLNLNELYFEYKEEVMDAIQFMKHEYPIIDKIRAFPRKCGSNFLTPARQANV